MPRSSREIVRTAVGIAAFLPAVALGVLAVVLFLSGGFGGFLAGVVVVGLAIALAFVAVMMTHAPVTIHNLLRESEEKRQGGEAEDVEHSAGDHTNGHH